MNNEEKDEGGKYDEEGKGDFDIVVNKNVRTNTNKTKPRIKEYDNTENFFMKNQNQKLNLFRRRIKRRRNLSLKLKRPFAPFSEDSHGIGPSMGRI